MALETLDFQQDPFNYGHKDLYTKGASYGYWDSLLSNADSFLPDVDLTGNDGVATGICPSPVGAPVAVQGRRKRRRTKSLKNKEEMESQRMTHIAVERNRRKLMNDYLAVLRSLMPPSYAQRGDQASIVGGAINFVKELEQLVQFLESHKQAKQKPYDSPPFANFFSFPQYSTRLTGHNGSVTGQDQYLTAEKGSTVADVEVALIESHANVKILSRKQPKQLLKIVAGFHSLGLPILHLNVTTVDQMVLHSLSVKVGDECQLNTVNEIATAIHEMMGKIQEEAISS
ncbi:hypothetical protein RHMOL_Rhmol10G0249200 [Rhododendron molle]|uniref:Uncharacterized protein n=1 Tax=Rhododendron molle TaxID=49168 RepID=A0ACC0M5P6_RHOML|nr:hypothetical protein RHMOL_Rhmol10G0249200 [Rhododendron molle]